MPDSRTTMCVYCLKRPATRWGCYVKDGRKKVMAGWCSRHSADDMPGFVGLYFADMGRQYDKKGKWR